jgi:hypothetical protein
VAADNFPAYQDAIRGLFQKFSDALRQPDSEWVRAAASAGEQANAFEYVRLRSGPQKWIAGLTPSDIASEIGQPSVDAVFEKVLMSPSKILKAFKSADISKLVEKTEDVMTIKEIKTA